MSEQAVSTDVRLPAPPPDSVRALLQTAEVQKRFEQVLADRAPQFIASLAQVVYHNPGLKKCDSMSVIGAALVAASLDLPIDPNLGYAAIVPYKDHAQFQMQWKGYVQLAHRTQQYAAIHVTEIYEGEVAAVNRFTGTISFGQRVGDKVTGYLAYFKLLNGFEKFLYMTTEEIDAHGKRYSKSFEHAASPWQTNREVMYRKTPIKLLLKTWGVLSVEMRTAMQAELPPDENGHGPQWAEETASAGEESPEERKARLRADQEALWGDGEESRPAAEPKKADNGQPTPRATLKGKKYLAAFAQFVKQYPYYAGKGGAPDVERMAQAAYRDGYKVVTDENLADVLASLEAREVARQQMEAEAAAGEAA